MEPQNSSTLVVGTGVVNLVSAYVLARQNHSLVLIDQGPCPLDHQDWKKLGCTFGGENVRMYTYTEADNYNEKGSQLYGGMGEAFDQVIDDDGWLVRPKSTLNAQERSWIDDFHAVSPVDALQFAEDIYHVNIESGTLWESWIREAPELFEDIDLLQGILRIYSEREDFEAARQLHQRLGSFSHSIAVDKVADQYPVFEHAKQSDMLGGYMITKGFTLRVQDLCKKIIRYLMDYGAEFRWNTTFTDILLDPLGQVAGLLIDDRFERYRNYVISPGAYAGTSLHNTQTNNQLHGVLGTWLTIPNLYPELKHSMKIHKTGHVGEDTNITLIKQGGRPVLVLGSGYGYVGNSNRNHVENEELEGIFTSLKHTARTYFPEAYEEAAPYIDTTKKYCVRSWTPTGLGIFEAIATLDGGRLIITGGNNTGGFTQAPYIAEAVAAMIREEYHPLHRLFHPRRMSISEEVSVV